MLSSESVDKIPSTGDDDVEKLFGNVSSIDENDDGDDDRENEMADNSAPNSPDGSQGSGLSRSEQIVLSAHSFEGVERMRQLEDEIHLLPSEQNRRIMNSVSPPRNNTNRVLRRMESDSSAFQWRQPSDVTILNASFEVDREYNLTSAISMRRPLSLPARTGAADNNLSFDLIGDDDDDETGLLGGSNRLSIFRPSPIRHDSQSFKGSFSPNLPHRTFTQTYEDDIETGPITNIAENSHSNEIVEGRSKSYDKLKSIRYILYLSAFAILGSVIRVFLARLFGGDCEDHNIDDFLSPLSKKICVTAGGRTDQSGGALFRDLPSNLLGSFVMGLITPGASHPHEWLPWLRADHHLQKDDVLKTAFAVGLCGSLTTFSSWNSQMVVMLDGSHTALGPQIASVFFGYVLGLIGAIVSFIFGSQIQEFVISFKSSRTTEVIVESDNDDDNNNNDTETEYNASKRPYDNGTSRRRSSLLQKRTTPQAKHGVFILVGGVLSLFVIGYIIYGIEFYRDLLLASAVTPFGALLRWYLAKKYASLRPDSNWFPWGTFTANILAVLSSILVTAIHDRYYVDKGYDSPWVIAALFAVKTGFAGSLSTVSTFVKEIVLLSRKYPNHAKSHIYALSTIIVSLLPCLILYSVIVRI